MLVSNLGNLNEHTNSSIIQDLNSSIEVNFTPKFLLILEDIFDQKQSDKFNSHYGLESVSNVYKDSLQSLLNLPNVKKSNDQNSLIGSNEVLLHSLGLHVGMIYDLGCSFHSKMYVLKEQVVDILIGAFGGPVNITGNSIFVNVSGKLDVSNDKLIAKIRLLYTYILREANDFAVINSIESDYNNFRKVWVKNKTRKIAKLTRRFYLNESLQLNENSTLVSPIENRLICAEKLVGYSNFLTSSFNHQQHDSIDLESIFSNLKWDQKEDKQRKNYLARIIGAKPANIDLLSSYNQEVKFCIDLIILAKRSKEIDRGERLYIYEYGKKINWDHHEIDGLLF